MNAGLSFRKFQSFHLHCNLAKLTAAAETVCATCDQASCMSCRFYVMQHLDFYRTSPPIVSARPTSWVRCTAGRREKEEEEEEECLLLSYISLKSVPDRLAAHSDTSCKGRTCRTAQQTTLAFTELMLRAEKIVSTCLSLQAINYTTCSARFLKQIPLKAQVICLSNPRNAVTSFFKQLL